MAKVTSHVVHNNAILYILCMCIVRQTTKPPSSNMHTLFYIILLQYAFRQACPGVKLACSAACIMLGLALIQAGWLNAVHYAGINMAQSCALSINIAECCAQGITLLWLNVVHAFMDQCYQASINMCVSGINMKTAILSWLQNDGNMGLLGSTPGELLELCLRSIYLLQLQW